MVSVFDFIDLSVYSLLIGVLYNVACMLKGYWLLFTAKKTAIYKEEQI
jgi:hypothetical protein